MLLDWTRLAVEVESIQPSGERGGTLFAQRALACLIGTENIAGAVEHVLVFAPGSELAMNVLRHLSSQEAAEMAYRAHREGGSERAARAVWLIKHIANPCALPWIEGFLRDDNVAGWGIGVLDQLIWTRAIDPEEPAIMPLLEFAERHSNENVREQAANIRAYLDEHGYKVDD